MEGGTVNACDVQAGECDVIGSALDLPTAVTVGKDGTVYVAENTAVPGGTSTIRPLNWPLN